MDETVKQLLKNDLNKHAHGEITITIKSFYRGELVCEDTGKPIIVAPGDDITIKYKGLDVHAG